MNNLNKCIIKRYCLTFKLAKSKLIFFSSFQNNFCESMKTTLERFHLNVFNL